MTIFLFSTRWLPSAHKHTIIISLKKKISQTSLNSTSRYHLICSLNSKTLKTTAYTCHLNFTHSYEFTLIRLSFPSLLIIKVIDNLDICKSNVYFSALSYATYQSQLIHPPQNTLFSLPPAHTFLSSPLTRKTSPWSLTSKHKSNPGLSTQTSLP